MVHDKPPGWQEAASNTKEREPKIHLKFFFARHLTPEDHKELKELIRDVDVVAVENVGWTEESNRHLNEASQDESGESLPDDDYYSPLRAFRGSKKPIISIDVSKDHPEFSRLEQLHYRVGVASQQALESLLNGDYESAVEASRQGGQYLFVAVAQLRDRTTEDQLRNIRQQIDEKFPELDTQNDINMLIVMGLSHTQVHHDLKRDGADVSLNFSEFPVKSHSILNEVVSRMRHSKDIPERLLALYPIETLLGHVWGGLTKDTDKIIFLERAILNQLSDHDVRLIYTRMKFSPNRNVQIVLDFLEEKGIEVPRSPEDVDRLLKEKYRVP
ncbi:MAG: hypothetical protein A3A33_01445 [Candidatus Yanofskybacteria bacterium RIFCSPLOWO2_01_FULL_49_25]|uniref:Uncharacterized protein n=1 Tax=Candidatus Yanofskybacteria bacterium RIFCSPLOWO2_01_FULL_49_25 TaxID=1802701 RepID=A0A1F8GZ92_9BACT|nr:MAG: hypothetical protein A3A33_01445 [Candidatus Yanofskybacteria bacterium RIFCSPLOWO2_01_FULL_49_25]